MKGLLIALCIITVIIVLLVILKIEFEASYDGNKTNIGLKICGFKVKKKKHKDKKDNKKEKKEKKKIDFDFFKSNLSIIADCCRLVKRVLGLFFHELKIKKLYIDIIVGAEDSAHVAMLYGHISSAVYQLQSILLSNFSVKDKHIEVKADFEKEKCEFKGAVKLKISLFDTFTVFWAILIGALRIYLKTHKKEKAV